MGTNGRTGREQCGHGTGAASQAASIRRTAGSVSGATGRLRLVVFFSNPNVLQEGKGDHGKQSMMVQAVP